MLKILLEILKPMMMQSIQSGRTEYKLFIRHEGEIIEFVIKHEADLQLLPDSLDDGTLVKYQATTFLEQPNEQQS